MAQELAWRRYGSGFVNPLPPVPRPRVCDNCGHRIGDDRPVQIGGWTLHADRAFFQGSIANVRPDAARVMHLLAHAAPDPINSQVIGDRLFPQSLDPRNYVGGLVHGLRKRLGAACPIATAPGLRGYYWKG